MGSLRVDGSVTVRVPATGKRKAYSYTKEGGSKSGGNKKGIEDIKAPLVRALPGLAAAGSLALLNSKLREKQYSVHEERARAAYSAHEEKIKRENNITDEDIENAKKQSKQKKKKSQSNLKRLALKGS